MQQIASGQAYAEIVVNENTETLEHQAVYGKRHPGTSGLTWGYYGGRWGGFSVADGTLSLTASSTNYIVVAIADGVISVSTASTNWDNDTDYVRVYKITTGTSTVSSVEDHRAGPGGVHGGGAGGGGGAGVTDGDKGDITVSGSGATWNVDNDAITYAKMQNVSATSRIIGRKTAAAGDPEECTLSEVLDFIGSAAQGDILYRGASGWARLGAGTSGHYLQTQGTGANPQWAAASGGGSGGTKTYAVHTPMTSQPPASNFATLDTRNSIAVLDFDASADEEMRWVGVMPEAASLGSGLTIRIFWMATSATSGTCRWGAQIESMTTDLDSDSFDAAATAGGTANATSGIPTVTEITITTIDGLAAGGLYRLRVYRDADGTSGTDDMTGDAELIAVEIRSAA